MMRTSLSLSLSLSLTLAGCGGTHYEDSSEGDWSSSTSGATTSSGVDAGVDGGVDGGADGGHPVRDRAMVLLARSCTPCHRHDAPIDPAAVARGVYLETDAEILQLASGYSVGRTPMSLRAVIAQRDEGYDLMVGEANNLPMPPRGTSYQGFTQQEAHEVMAWLTAPR